MGACIVDLVVAAREPQLEVGEDLVLLVASQALMRMEGSSSCLETAPNYFFILCMVVEELFGFSRMFLKLI